MSMKLKTAIATIKIAATTREITAIIIEIAATAVTSLAAITIIAIAVAAIEIITQGTRTRINRQSNVVPCKL